MIGNNKVLISIIIISIIFGSGCIHSDEEDECGCCDFLPVEDIVFIKPSMEINITPCIYHSILDFNNDGLLDIYSVEETEDSLFNVFIKISSGFHFQNFTNYRLSDTNIEYSRPEAAFIDLNNDSSYFPHISNVLNPI